MIAMRTARSRLVALSLLDSCGNLVQITQLAAH